MARKALIEKTKRLAKRIAAMDASAAAGSPPGGGPAPVKAKTVFRTRMRNRCDLCGRPRGYMRMFGICRICFRTNALKGMLPGVKKASW